jgi:tetratricopeptide (TPR) repeat protein
MSESPASSAPASPTPFFDPTAPLLKREHIHLALLLLGLAAAVSATHWPALSARAVCFDDAQYVFANRLVRNPSLDSAARFLTEVLQPSSVSGYYQPITMLSLMMDVALGGDPDDVTVFHRTSLAIHVLNTLLIAFFLYRLFGSPVPAALAALLFGVHPLTVESIPWLGERKTLLATFFALCSLILYLEYVRDRVSGWLIGAAVAYALSLLSKPTTTPLPVLMLLLDFWPLARLSWKSVIEKLPLFAIGAICGIITLVSQARTAGIGPQGDQVLPTVALTICHNIVFYLHKMVQPVDLSPHYPFPFPFNFSQPMLVAGLSGTLILIGVLIVSLKWTRALLAGGLFFFVGLLPTFQIVGFTYVIASDKYVYLPALGILIILCWLFAGIWRPHATAGPDRVMQVGLVVVVLGLAAAEARATRDYLRLWRDSESLHRYMYARAPDSPFVCEMLAGDLILQGRFDEALQIQYRAAAVPPPLPSAHFNLASTLLHLNRIDEAMKHFGKAIELKPDYAAPYANLGLALIRQGKRDEGMLQLRKAVELEPAFAEAHFNLATAYAEQNQVNDALNHFVQAILHRPNFPEAHFNLGTLLANLAEIEKKPERLQKAADNFLQAVRLNPNYLQAHNSLARVFERLGRRNEALYEYQQVLRLNPKDEQAAKAVTILVERFGVVPRKP